jgi:hypothetical protein
MAQQELNMSYLPGNEGNMMNIASNNAVKSLAEETKQQRALYPEIHYKLEPFISSTCDAIESSGVMPTEEELDDITDGVFDDFCKVYPDMADYMRANDNENDLPEAVPTQIFGGGFRPGRFRRFRRRGLGRDLIRALILARLFGRRRFPFFFL